MPLGAAKKRRCLHTHWCTVRSLRYLQVAALLHRLQQFNHIDCGHTHVQTQNHTNIFAQPIQLSIQKGADQPKFLNATAVRGVSS